MNIEFPSPQRIPALRALWKTAFGDTDLWIDHFFRTAFSPDRCRILTQDGQVAAALYWFDCFSEDRKFAYLYAVATASGFRGRGFCRALMADTHSLLKENGYAGTILVPAGDGLFGMYEKMGYHPFSGIETLTCTAAGTVTEMTEISPERYAFVRREYLPSGGVVQERENLRFLSGMARFFLGTDFILAAEVEDHTLRGLELLGNTTRGPEILGALGFSSGTFRIPGSSHFAMYCPLSESMAPGYFGLSVD